MSLGGLWFFLDWVAYPFWGWIVVPWYRWTLAPFFDYFYCSIFTCEYPEEVPDLSDEELEKENNAVVNATQPFVEEE